MLTTRRGVALVRRASPQPANDNVAGTITPDDRRFSMALAFVCALVLALMAYVVFSGPEDVMTVLLRR